MTRRTRWIVCIALATALMSVSSPAPLIAKRKPSDAIAGIPLSAHAVTRAIAPDIDAATGILETADGRELWSRSPTKRRPMASTTKLMTALLALRRGRLDEPVVVSRKAAGVEDATGLVAGQTFTERQLLQLMLVCSANDAAYALGEHLGGSMSRFVRMMNDEAASMGLSHTRYKNPHGLDAPGHFSCAADLAALARVDMGYPEFRRIVLMRSVRLAAPDGKSKVLGTTDELLGKYRGIMGVKTGFTDNAKYCFVASARRGGVSLIAVILGAKDDPARFRQSARLLDWGFKHTALTTEGSAEQTVGSVPIAGHPGSSAVARFAESSRVPAFDLGGPITRAVQFKPQVPLPVFEGEELGEIRLLQGGHLVATVDAVAAGSLASVGETIGIVPVSDYVDISVTARAGESTSVRAFDPSRPVHRDVVLEPRLSAPVSKGQRLGDITYSQDGQAIVKVPVVAGTSVERPGLLEGMGIWLVRGWRGMFGGPMTASLRVSAS